MTVDEENVMPEKKSGSDKPKKKAAAAKASETPASSKTESAQPASSAANADSPGGQLPSTRGKVGIFGGPKDRGIKPDDKLALPTGPHAVYERVRSLNPNSFYCAMRFEYRIGHTSPEEGKRWWANRKLLVTNPKNSRAVVVRAVDYGPHQNTGLDVSISPGAAAALEVEIGDEVDIAFADPRAQLGEVE
jgi:hypothetical protein